MAFAFTLENLRKGVFSAFSLQDLPIMYWQTYLI